MNKITKGLIISGIIISGIVAVYYIIGFYERSKSPVFTIISENGEPHVDYDANFNPIYTYTVYVKIKNVGIDGSKTVNCEITRYDLTTISKSQTVFLKANEEKIIDFFFSNLDLKGCLLTQYKIW